MRHDCRVVARARTDMNHVLSPLDVGTRQHRRVIGWRTVVVAALRRDSDQDVVVQVDGISIWRQDITAIPHDRPRTWIEKALARYGSECRLQPWIARRCPSQNLFGIGAADDGELLFAIHVKFPRGERPHRLPQRRPSCVARMSVAG